MTTQTGYYVTVIRDKRVGWLFGPCADHEVAKLMVAPVWKLASKIDPWCDFDAFGTAHIKSENPLPIGRLNNWFRR